MPESLLSRKPQVDVAGNPGSRADLPYFLKTEHAAIKQYYDDQGYVVVRGLVPAELLTEANRAFDADVYPSDRFIYRQTTANPERHSYSPQGFMLNPILNVQSLDSRYFKPFRAGSEATLTHAALQDVVAAVIGRPGKLVQSMYFQGNPATWPHQDTYYLDAEEIGAMAAVWIAAEDIAEGAGRFYVYPGSHRIDIHKNGGHFDVAFNHTRYKNLVTEVISGEKLERRAPALAKGDVLIWNSKTIHGSLPTTQPERSRRSFTGHYIPEDQRMLQFQARIMSQPFEPAGGMLLTRPKNQDRVINRAILFVETRFPTAFRLLKRIAIKVVTARAR